MKTETSKHTPGPWEVNKYNLVIYPKIKPTREICGMAIYDSPIKKDGTAEANARLIASAPELLEALKDLRHIIVSYNQSRASSIDHIGGSAINKSDKAIAKAESSQ